MERTCSTSTRHSFSLLQIKNECSCNDDWEKGVQQTYDGCAKVFSSYRGPTKEIGETVITSFETYIKILKNWNQSNSTILSTSSTAILQAIGLLSNVGVSASYLLNENSKATPDLVSAYTKIVTNLSKNIGKLTDPINEGIREFGRLSVESTKQFQHRFVEQKSEIDFKVIMKCGQLLANTIGLIVETALNDCGCVTIANDTYEAIAVLVYILNDCFLSIQGIIVSMAAVLYSESDGITDFIHNCLLALDPFVQGIADSINSMTTGMDIAKCVRGLLTSLVDLIRPLNDRLDDLLGPFEGTKITVAHVRKNLLTS